MTASCRRGFPLPLAPPHGDLADRASGDEPELIAEQVGHRDGGGLVYRRYRHLFPSEVRAAVGLLDALVSDTNGVTAADESGQ